MTERLTKNELTWLLAQEARTAAQKLRRGVGMYSGDEAPPPITVIEEGSGGVESTLNQLDEAVNMLASLHGHPQARGRRGKIDLAALLWEVAPEARVQIEMGEGTAVFGDESELRRMLLVLLGHGGDPSSSAGALGVTVKREGDEVRVGVNLGPDMPSTFETERVWLSRMAVRYGGRLELDGSMQTLILAADVDTHRRELESLKKELAAAQAQGEAYARELAAVFSREGGAAVSRSSMPLSRPSRMPQSSGDALAVLVASVRSLSTDLRGILASIGRDIAPLKDAGGEVGDIAGSVGRHITGASAVVADLARLGACPIGEQARHADVAEILREVCATEKARAARHDVTVSLSITGEGGTGSTQNLVEVGAFPILLQSLLDHAIEATPAGSEVCVTLLESSPAFTFCFDDAGPALPASARGGVMSRDFAALAQDRPQGLALIAASAIASHLRLSLELEDAPKGGTRVRLVAPRTSL